MAAPKGHKFSVGNNGGRPRVYDRDEEADALIEWAKKPDSFTLYGFTTERGYLAENLAKWAKDNKKFAVALKFAKEAIANRIVSGSLQKNYDGKVVLKILPMYSDSYKAERDFEIMKGKQEKIDSLAEALKKAKEE